MLNVAKAVAVGGYRFNLHVEDTDLWWRMALKYDVQFIPEALVGFRQHQMSVSSKNLTNQAVNTAYVQYLLLSHLRGVEALSLEDVRPVLLQLLSAEKLRFKTHLRAFNMELGRGRRGKAMWEAISALMASPQAFFRRLLDEFTSSGPITVGENPEIFAAHEKALWPRSAHNSASRVKLGTQKVLMSEE
jgi:hypothetical protein